MNFERVQAGSVCGVDTHDWKVFDRILRDIQYIDSWEVVDPFARNCPLAKKWSNDLNPTTAARFHNDASEWLPTVPSSIADLVIFDPPFSAIQAERKYGEHINIYNQPHIIPDMMLEINRILKPSGLLVKFGYNSTRHLKTLEFVKGYLVNFGGLRNDVIVTVWKKNQTSILEWGGEE